MRARNLVTSHTLEEVDVFSNPRTDREQHSFIVVSPDTASFAFQELTDSLKATRFRGAFRIITARRLRPHLSRKFVPQLGLFE